ncbi:hypothetical protein E2C01_054150 [Portunus trituberculatus]|uniref:Uncharacterized protein n=1 Tax=Portunus trituberculatus TaxID=210409 RepID=A0A5B7GR63_PORTR|nr:hypothetical protein [Portunus trituberculatus]
MSGIKNSENSDHLSSDLHRPLLISIKWSTSYTNIKIKMCPSIEGG